MVQKALKMMAYREIFDGMLRAAALIMIMAMVAGACGKNDEPAGPDNNTEQPSKLTRTPKVRQKTFGVLLCQNVRNMAMQKD